MRAAAIAALVTHSDDDAGRWLKRGLKDPSPCVRVEAARLLDRFDPKEHRDIFELALYDGHPDVARQAQKLAEHKGFGRVEW